MNLQVIFYFQLSIIGLKQFKMLNEDFTVIVQNLHRPINCLIDQDRNIRKSGLQTILKEIPKIHKHHQTKILLTTHLNKNLLHTLSDPIEANREISLQILQLIFEQAELKKQQTDPFIIGLINRINTTPFPEKSEDIRLRIVNLMKKCISFKQSYAGNMTELTNALSKCLDDDNGEMKIATCELINLLSKEFKTVIGKHSTSITKSLSDNINHRKFIVRKNVLITISNLLSTDGAGGNFEHVQQKIKGILSDPKIEVRKAAYECIASITKCIAPKYLKQYEAILVSFLLSGLSDESAENIGLCIKLLEECGESIKELYGEETEG